MLMATKRTVIISDDIDGSSDAETVSFGIDGASYEIDLAAKNRGKLEKAFAPFVEHGRRVSGRRRQRSASHAATTRQENAAIRTWAKSAGLPVSERGRISADVIRQYEVAH
jgi:hypothetical protein